METPQTRTQEPLADVMELCTMMQCLGFSVKSLETSGIGCSQKAGVKTVVINCQSSGLQVVLESGNANCSCPIANFQTSGLWQVSGMAGGKLIDQETGSFHLGTLPNVYREHVASKLREIVKGIKENNDTDSEGPRKEALSKSVSTGDLITAEMSDVQVSVDSPSQCRSLDTLTSAKDESALLPAPGVLQELAPNISAGEGAKEKGPEGSSKFASSPNLSGVASSKQSSTLSMPKCLETFSTSNIKQKQKPQEKVGKIAKLKRCVSHNNMFTFKKSSGVKDKTQDSKNN